MEACAILAADAVNLGNTLANGGLSISAKAPGENPQTVNSLTYSRKVYLFHEDALTHAQMAEVEKLFDQYQLSVVLRGPDFVTQAWLQWKRREASAGIVTPVLSRPEVTLDYTHSRRSFARGQGLKSVRNRPFTLAVAKESAYNLEVKPIAIGGGTAVFPKQAILHVLDGSKEIHPTITKPDGPVPTFCRHEFDWLVIDEWDAKSDLNAQVDIDIQIEYEDGSGTVWGTKEVLHFAPITLETSLTHVEFFGPLPKRALVTCKEGMKVTAARTTGTVRP